MTTVPESSAPPRRVPGRTLAGVLLLMFLVSIDATIVGPALPAMGASLGDFEQLPWVITGYLLAATAVSPLYGKMSDLYGRRVMVFVGVSAFLGGSVLCALSPSVALLAVSRVIQGAGGGGFSLVANAIIGDSVPPRERGRYQGYVSGAYTAGAVAGPLLGGLLTDYAHWSMIFWINVPVGLVSVALLGGALPRKPRDDQPRRLDMLGAAQLAGASCALMFALSWGGARYPWASGEIVGLAVAALALLGWYIAHAQRVEEPVLPLGLLRGRIIAPASLISTVVMAANIGLTIYLPVYFQLVGGFSPSASGALLLIMMFAVLVGSYVVGTSMNRTKFVVRLMYALFVVACLGLLGMAWQVHALSPAISALLTIPVGLAIGAVYPFTTVTAQNASEHRHLGVTIGLIGWMRTVGGAVGGAIFGAVLLGSTGSTDALLHGAGAASPQVADAFRIVFVLAAAAFAVALFCTAIMEHRPLRGHH